MHSWPRRRLVTTVMLAPVIFGVVTLFAEDTASADSWWYGIVAIVSIISAATLATYVPAPGAGRRPDLGCAPCAAFAALAVMASILVLTSMSPDLSNGILALSIVTFGFVRRLTTSASCEVSDSAGVGSVDVGQLPGREDTHQA